MHTGSFVAESTVTSVRQPKVTVYLGNIKRSLTEDDVRQYLISNNIHPSFARIIPTKREGAGNGAKCVITESEFNIMTSLVLPSGIYVRKWYQRNTASGGYNTQSHHTDCKSQDTYCF